MTYQLRKFSIASPTRVDLAGGTLDLWPLYNFITEATTINVAIDIWTHVEVCETAEKKISIESKDLNKSWSFLNIEELLEFQDEKLNFYKTVFKQFKTEFSVLNLGVSFKTSSQSPVGGGLGGSSSLTVSILKALYVLFNKNTPTAHELVYLAHNIEAEMLGTPTGTQDYYPAISGGVNVLQYTARGISQSILNFENTPLESHFLLVYTGKSHHSGINNFEVLKSAVAKDPIVLGALVELKEISSLMLSAINERKWDRIPDLFRREFKSRIQLTPAFSSEEIMRLSDICLKNGAEAIKICGAGGGGCVLVWVSPQNREKVVSACQKENFRCLNAKPVNLPI